jgi:hypothetical protein
MRRGPAGSHVRAAHLVGLLAAVILAACSPIPEDFGRSPTPGGGSGGGGSPGPGASPGVTVGGDGKVTVVGLGGSRSDTFELPAGDATMVITACQSNQVMPFITLFHESGASAGLVVDPEKVLRGLVGGTYYISAQTNPDCVWQVEITPGAG